MPAASSIARAAVSLSAAAALLAAAPAPAQLRPDPPGAADVFRLTEPRIPPLPESQWTADHRARVDRWAPEVRIGNAFRTLLNVPELVDAVMPFLVYTARETTHVTLAGEVNEPSHLVPRPVCRRRGTRTAEVRQEFRPASARTDVPPLSAKDIRRAAPAGEDGS